MKHVVLKEREFEAEDGGYYLFSDDDPQVAWLKVEDGGYYAFSDDEPQVTSTS